MEIYDKLIRADRTFYDHFHCKYLAVPCYENSKTRIQKVSYDDVRDLTVELYKLNHKLGYDNQTHPQV